MFKSDLFRTVAAALCTMVFSATAVVAAVGPGAGTSPVAVEARLAA